MVKRVKVAFFLIFCLGLILFRRPDAFTNPQFFAEDGHYWFADAYHKGGISSIFAPSAGYLQVVSRLTASISQVLPLRFAPFFFNFSALLIHLLPIFYLISSRFSRFPLSGRIYLCVSYLLLTNTIETYLNITNAQWYLALSFFLVLVAQPTKSLFWKLFDTVVLSLGGLSGPFSLLILPVVFYLIFRKKIKISAMSVQVVFFTACLQLLSLLFVGSSDGGRLTNHLTFGPEAVYKIFYRQILWGVLAGPFGYDWVVARIPASEIVFLVTTISCSILLLYAAWKANSEIKGFFFFTAIIFFTSLISPTVYADGQRTVYDVLFEADGIRYWLIPMICLLVIFIWGIHQKQSNMIQILSGVFLGILTFFQVKHIINLQIMRYPAFADYHWEKEVAEFEKLPVGTSKMFLINPPGWQMTLKKKD